MFRTNRAWKKIDLEGAGLQTLNLYLSRRMKKRRTAYLLWLLFPLGAHRFYLEERLGATAYLGTTLLALLLWAVLDTLLAVGPLLLAFGFALYDLIWIDRRVTAFNKRTRMELYLTTGAAPPAGYRGRYVDDGYLDDYIRIKESEKAGVQPVRPPAPVAQQNRRVPSLAEQEAMLRELAKAKQKRNKG